MTTLHPDAIPTKLPSIPLVPISSDPGLTALGMTFMQVLQKRQTMREVSLETLSRLLWAAFGINRPDGAHRTAPSAKNAQEIDIYVALAQGLYVFDPHAFALHRYSRTTFVPLPAGRILCRTLRSILFMWPI